MAKPRIFLSSTFYDLKSTRADIERFIREQGYEPILNEMGHIPYGSQDELDKECYREISNCDILVSIIGGRFGSTSSMNSSYSVSNYELKTAQELGKQVYIFIENPVYSEYRTYGANKGNDTINYVTVDDTKIFDFIGEIHGMHANNQISPFNTVIDIISYLKEQWAGLFQRLLSEQSNQDQLSMIEKINKTSQTLQEMVDYLTKANESSANNLENIIMNNHPAFSTIAKMLNINHRIYFQNYSELTNILSDYGFVKAGTFKDSDEYVPTWVNIRQNTMLTIDRALFDDDLHLKPETSQKWNPKWISIEYEFRVPTPPPPPPPGSIRTQPRTSAGKLAELKRAQKSKRELSDL